MATVISFISRKGGTGKTTNAIHTATALHENNYRVLLIETDQNYTLSTLRKMEVFKQPKPFEEPFRIMGSDDSRIADEIHTLRSKKEYDFIIVDSAGKTTDSHIRQLCLESDVVVVPTGLTQNDLLVAYQTIEDLKAARQLKNTLRIVVLPNRLHGRTNIDTIRKKLENLDAEILDVFVPAKNSYAEYSTLKTSEDYFQVVRKMINI